EGAMRHVDEDGRATVFLMPGILYDELGLARLRHALRDQVRFVLIHYPGWRETISGKADFDIVVTAALEQVLSQCGDGPIHLAGYSFGGFVAFATAQRLVQSGRRVAFLGLLDTRRRTQFAALPLRAYLKQRDVGVFLRLFLRFLLKFRAFVLLEIFARLCMKVAGRRADSQLLFVLRSHAFRSWRPHALSVPTFFFRSADHLEYQPYDCGWSEVCSPLRVVPIEGDHGSMLSPAHTERLCANFLEALYAADASSGSLMLKPVVASDARSTY